MNLDQDLLGRKVEEDGAGWSRTHLELSKAENKNLFDHQLTRGHCSAISWNVFLSSGMLLIALRSHFVLVEPSCAVYLLKAETTHPQRTNRAAMYYYYSLYSSSLYSSLCCTCLSYLYSYNTICALVQSLSLTGFGKKKGSLMQRWRSEKKRSNLKIGSGKMA